MIGSAILGGLILAMIEGVGILFMRMGSEQYRPLPMEDPSQLGSVAGSHTPMSGPFASPQYQ